MFQSIEIFQLHSRKIFHNDLTQYDLGIMAIIALRGNWSVCWDELVVNKTDLYWGVKWCDIGRHNGGMTSSCVKLGSSKFH